MASSLDLHRRHQPSKLQVIGQELYAQQKYEEAIEAFTASIKASNGSPGLSLLSLRTAAYEKLGKLPLALKDGRAMIELDAYDAQGYLVTGHLLRRMHNDTLASKIYERGLRHCKDPSGLERLQSKLSKMKGSGNSKNQVDLIEKLPNELVDMILSYVPFPTLCLSLKVSKSWRTYLKSRPSIWTSLDLSSATTDVRAGDLQ